MRLRAAMNGSHAVRVHAAREEAPTRAQEEAAKPAGADLSTQDEDEEVEFDDLRDGDADEAGSGADESGGGSQGNNEEEDEEDVDENWGEWE